MGRFRRGGARRPCGLGRSRRRAGRQGRIVTLVDTRRALRRRQRLDGPSLGPLRAARLDRLRRLGPLRPRLPRAHAPRKVPGPRLAALHGADGHVAGHAGRRHLRRRLLVPLLLGADDRGVVPADPLRRRAARGAARGPLVPHHDARGLRAARRGLRHAGQHVRRRDVRHPGRIFPHAAGPAAAARLPGGLRHEGRHVPAARLAPGGAPRSPVARLGPHVGRDDQDGHLRHPARRRGAGRPARAAHGGLHPARRRHRYGRVGRDPRRAAERHQAAAGLLLDREHRHHPARRGHRGAGQGLGQPLRGALRPGRGPAPHLQPLALQVAALLRRPAPRRSTHWADWHATCP